MEMLHKKIYELDKICRICLSENGKMKSLYDSCLDTMLNSVTNIQVNLGDGLPELICFQCVLQISRTFRFKKQCEKSDEILRNYIKTTINENLINQKCITDDDVIKEIISFGKNEDQVKDHLSNSNKIGELIKDSINETEDFKKSFNILQNDDYFKFKISPGKENESLKCDNVKISKKNEEKHDNKPNPIINYEFERPNLDYPCAICSKIFTKRKALLRHIKIHDNLKPYECSECDKQFVEKSNLTKHMKKHTGELRNIVGKPNLCTVCGKSFKWASSLSKHMQYHTKNKIYKCPHCPKFYVEKRTLHIHLRNHTGEKPFKCNVCNKSFTQLCNLEKHLYVHANEKPFSCKICNKKFSQSGYIKIHMRSHTGEKPYQCQECGKCFSSSSNLIIHKKRHRSDAAFSSETADCRKTTVNKRTGEKPHQCTICLKRFISTNQLTQHKQLHTSTNNSDFICKICNKDCLNNFNLKKHIKMHCQNVEKFQCVFCEEIFETVIERDAHQQDHATIIVFENSE